MIMQASISDNDISMALQVLQSNVGEVEEVAEVAEDTLDDLIEKEEEGKSLVVFVIIVIVYSIAVFEEITSSSGMLSCENTMPIVVVALI